jgi:hypothetical protein
MTRQTNVIACSMAHALQPAIADGASVPAGSGPGEARGALDLTTDRGASAASSVMVDRYDHVAATAYVMRHHGVTALAVRDGDRSARPIGMITETDITRAAADGEDLNQVLIGQLISQSPGSNQRPAGPEISD